MEVLENIPTLPSSWKYVQQSLELIEKLECNPEEVLGVPKLQRLLPFQHFKLREYIVSPKLKTMA